LNREVIEIDDIIANETMHHQRKPRAATAKRDTTTAQWHSTVDNKKNVNPSRATKRGKVAVQHTETQHLLTENHSHRASHVHDVNKTAASNVTAVECLEEFTATARKLVTGCYRVIAKMYSTLMAIAHLTVLTGKLTWKLGCLTMVVGRCLYGILA
jgi:hypothetical protein